MRVADTEDPRWSVALDVLLSGQGSIELGDLATIRWWTKGVGADPFVHVDVQSQGDPKFLTRTKGEREIAQGLAAVESAASVHDALGELLRVHSVRRHFVRDYGKGTVVIAEITEDGSIEWNEKLSFVERGSE